MIDMTVVWGLLSATIWGAGDFCGGLATRRASVWIALFYSQFAGLLLLLLCVWSFGEPMPPWRDLGWGAAAGLAGLVGLTGLYQAMALGQVALVAPLTAVIALSIPVAAAVGKEGLPPLVTLVGFGLAAISIVLISYGPQGATTRGGLLLALLSGCGFGAFFVLIAQPQASAVFWPIVAARASALLVLVLLLVGRRTLAGPPRNILLLMILTGIFDAGGNAFFVLAEQAGRLDIASTLSSLYPVSTVILAFLFLRERLSKTQSVGVALALGAIPLIAMN